MWPKKVSSGRYDEHLICISCVNHPSAKSLLHSRGRLLRDVRWQFDDQIHAMSFNVVQPPMVGVVLRDVVYVIMRHIDTF